MTANPTPLSYEQYQAGSHSNAAQRQLARQNLVKFLKEKAKCEHAYRKALAVAFAKHRGSGKPVAESEIMAKADAAGHALNRDMADAEAKAASARLAELEGERATLRQLAEWGREAVGE